MLVTSSMANIHSVARLAADLPLRCEFSCLESSKHRLCRPTGLGAAWLNCEWEKCLPLKDAGASCKCSYIYMYMVCSMYIFTYLCTNVILYIY